MSVKGTTGTFRGQRVPKYVKSKKDLVAWALETFEDGEPISNWEFVDVLRAHRFGDAIFNLRKEGYDITTLKTKTRGRVVYYLNKIDK